MVITRIGPISCAKISGTLYALVGLFIGGFISLAALAGVFGSNTPAQGAGFAMMFGAGAIVVLPLLYGCTGFVATLVAAWLYNLLAGVVGGIEVDMQ